MSDDFYIDFSEIIKTKRKEMNLTQKELSEMTGLSLRTIQRIENEPGAKINLKSLGKLSEALKVPLIRTYLETGSEYLKQVDIDGMLACYNALNSKGKLLIKELAYDLSQLDKYRNKEAEE